MDIRDTDPASRIVAKTMQANFRIVGFMLLLLDSIFALPYDHLNDQVEAAIDSGTFQDPSVNVRPRFRFW